MDGSRLRSIVCGSVGTISFLFGQAEFPSEFDDAALGAGVMSDVFVNGIVFFMDFFREATETENQSCRYILLCSK